MSRATDTTTNGSDRPATARRRSHLPAFAATLPVDLTDVSRRAVEPCIALLLVTMEREGLNHVRKRSVPRAEVELTGVGPFVLSWRGERYHDAIVRPGDAVALLASHGGRCEVVVAAADRDTAERHAAALADRLREEPPPEDLLPVSFWSQEDGFARVRKVDAPELADVALNYPATTRAVLAGLAAARQRGAGSLLLWHGPPGTGKTHALRALARAWREWAALHYVTDAERFLTSPKYLLDVATDDEDDRRVRLVALEDAGELMRVDARTEVGQGLSRVLNLADGLLGQGVPCVLIVTTNEPVGRLHPAVRRPGRCWAEVEFPAFPAPEATAWLARRGVERDVAAPMTLAELYAAAEGRELPSAGPEEPFGFARGAPRTSAAATAAPPASSTSEAITK
jgi:hypothetical protein